MARPLVSRHRRLTMADPILSSAATPQAYQEHQEQKQEHYIIFQLQDGPLALSRTGAFPSRSPAHKEHHIPEAPDGDGTEDKNPNNSLFQLRQTHVLTMDLLLPSFGILDAKSTSLLWLDWTYFPLTSTSKSLMTSSLGFNF